MKHEIPYHVKTTARRNRTSLGEAGMTLIEVLIAGVLFLVVFGTIMNGFIEANRNTAWITFDAAASRVAEQRVEEVLNARWLTTVIPAVDEMVSSNFPSRTVIFENNSGSGNSIIATSTVQISTSASSLSYKVIRADVTWSLFGRGPFTNSAVTIDGPN